MKIKDMLEEMKNNSNKLEVAVINDILNHDDGDNNILEYMQQVRDYGCASGIVANLVYYHQTKEFFVNYMDDIFDLYNELNEEVGLNFELNSNRLSWFAYEEINNRLLNELEYKLEEDEDELEDELED